jgi:uncharacterized protein
MALVKCYVDTSILVAAHCLEPATGQVQSWLAARRPSELVGCSWLLTEVASALSIKERRGEINRSRHQAISSDILVFLAQCVTLEPPTENDFEVAATFCHNAASRLRAGDALHLAVALRLKTRYIATLDGVLLENALARGLLDGLLLS